MRQWLLSQWYNPEQRHSWLTPLAWCFRGIVRLRKTAYQYGLLHVYQPSVPTIIVGNITVGGTGKTPLVTALVKHLQSQGLRVGIISRGYGGKAQYPQSVTTDSKVAEVGDEALLLATVCQCPMVVDPNRARAHQTLTNQHELDVVISDDGLQHYALGRSIEIGVVDGQRRFGNQQCLPAGPCREPILRWQQCDLRVSTGTARDDEYAMTIEPGAFIHCRDQQRHCNAQDLNKNTVTAIAGIGNPQRFFYSLQQLGIAANTIEFPDHHRYQPAELAQWQTQTVVMTAKDAVKCRQFAGDDWWYLDINAVLPTEFYQALDRLLAACQTTAVNISQDQECC